MLLACYYIHTIFFFFFFKLLHMIKVFVCYHSTLQSVNQFQIIKLCDNNHCTYSYIIVRNNQINTNDYQTHTDTTSNLQYFFYFPDFIHTLLIITKNSFVFFTLFTTLSYDICMYVCCT